jgi:hypothetical protein
MTTLLIGDAKLSTFPRRKGNASWPCANRTGLTLAASDPISEKSGIPVLFFWDVDYLGSS